ncbi:MAG TPA: hypothetical protein PK052_01095 [Anaerohalosphaeraceae bacterium]|nr:hypothetical protein [Phycisphaerae bacterium]HOK95017.1 hypothetical protein [Anaerohalosphaeraceae bacterium]HOL30552.1 hypothetical protein [Anaerohalosphaeraceae bacterium]HOM75196.1 hypothetical protein [Anaerohalosphaeraceae bacterium]HPC64010.1 hypothetical protein [Anaerohalosphaeraceae bacterium]
MNISMGFLKPVSGTLKKYTSLLPSVIIAIAALMMFIPTLWLGNKVKGRMENSVRTARSVQSAVSQVPSKDQPAEVKRYMDKLEEEAAGIRTLAVQSSQRDLITYDYVIFPEPTDPSSQIYIGFGQRYRSRIEDLIRRMHALDAPSDAEIRARTGAAARPIGEAYSPVRRPGTAQDPMVDALCQTRAQEISVYAHPKAFTWYDFWEKYSYTSKDQALQDCWDSQVAFWIYEDIVDTIVKLNGTSAQVTNAPVKRLMGVSFSGPVVAAGVSSSYAASEYYGYTAGMRDIPQYVTAAQPGIFVAASPTGRLCNEEMDIIHFAVSVLVDNRFVLAFMKELCSEKPHTFRTDFTKDGQLVESRHNQITILQSDVRVIDKSAAEHELYRYGKGAVMKLDLVCEYQFNRKGYDAIKPAPVKKRLETASGMPGSGPAASSPAAPAGGLGFEM